MIKLDHSDLVEAVKNYYESKQGYFVTTEVDVPITGIGRVDVVAFGISGIRPTIRSFECETEIRDVAKLRGKLTQLIKLSTHVYLVIPHYVYDSSMQMLLENIVSEGIGVIIVNEDKSLKEVFSSNIFTPQRKWEELVRKLTSKYSLSTESLYRAFEKIYNT